MAAPTGTGSTSGAQATFKSFLSGGKLPVSWWTNAQTIVKGPYAITTTAGIPGGPSLGAIQWKDATGATQHLYFDVNSDGTVSQAPGDTQTQGGGWLGKIGLIVADAEGMKAGGTVASQSQVKKVTQLASWTESLGKLLTYLTSSSFWKRVGIGLGGAILLVIGIIILMRKNIPTPESLVKAA